MSVRRGGCHCGDVRFEAEGDVEWAEECNCSICTPKAYVHWYVPRAHFRLLTPPERLATYRFGSGAAKHHFCRRCGVAPFYEPRSDPDKIDVNLRCVEGIELRRVEIRPFDGRHWEEAFARSGRVPGAARPDERGAAPGAVRTIDLRSDTVTLPTAAMREAMARAELGDDVYGEDPTVNRLEARAAELLGKESALFFPSGTMANQASLHVLTRPGDLLLAAADCHVLRYEAGAAAALAGLQIQTLGSGGRFTAGDVRAVLPPADPHFAPVGAIAVENTHNDAGGRVFPFEELAPLAALAGERGLRLHLDGARLWNAVVASGIPAERWAAPFDTVAFCFSKGLGAPVGSVVCCAASLREPLRRARKMLGGGMRQAGVLAAAGLHALDHHVLRLADDHANAARLAAGLEALGLRVEGRPETNIVMFHAPEALAFWRAAWERGVRFNPPGGTRLRAVTHLDVTADDVDDALQRLRACVA